MSKEADEDRLERHRIEGAVNFIGGIIKGAKDRDGDDGLLLCAENAEKAIRCLRVDKATLRARVAELEAALRASGEEHKTSEAQFSFYAEQHRAKSSPDDAKAVTNDNHALRCACASVAARAVMEKNDA